ncbi:GNAT family N-acetyltransferase [Undibacter mobilis]|uniref:N-acetyltransferase n=1 Tax=Undibacter mobilis TaxID=2292256 RepID=A0A371BA96_9BRAD|nr:N-acetyltransferase [Undibacter mobilis]RDV04484.1 N-acetyltransferase [Undibacter mobilis]
MTASASFAIRHERADDAVAIRRVLDDAFGGPAEGNLVERLRVGGDLVLALVAYENEAIIGYVAWPRLWIATPRDQYKAIALAPLAVAPAMQRRGIGSALTREGLAQLRASGESIVFVLGDPIYYGRFGFSVEAAGAYESMYAGTHLMALRLTDTAPDGGRLSYPAAFDEID